MPLQLSPAERQALKARAHALEPAVLVGGDGLTEAVTAEIERSLAAHELVKIRVAGEDRAAREDIFRSVCERVGAAPVQHIGKVLVLYRPAPAASEKSAAPRPARNRRKPPRALKRSFQHRR
ncbi:MAG TPA: YhbY family RNA-binding protein [Burkholderiales bacterium]|nr:YhbY family RNA-binding protein [Burkholderiales bacterium]